MNWPAYDSYRDAGEQWLGNIPDHWELRPLGFHFTERKTTVSDADYPPLSVTMGGIVSQLETAAKTDNPDNRKLVLAGDFVINSRSDRKGSAGISDRDGSVSVISTVLECKGIEASFVHHLLRSRAFQEEYYRFGSGIVADLWSTRYSAMKQITLAVPADEEQRSIANFLDRETAKIDALIAKQEHLIATLREDRAATITQAVTKGLDPHVEMKESGVEWLGGVPEHWTVSRFSRHIAINAGQVDPRVDPYRDMILIAPNHVESGTGRLLNTETAAEQGADSGKYRVSEGQVIYSKIRPNLSKVVIAPTDCLCSADMYGLSADPNQLSTGYVLYMLLSQPFTDYVIDSSMRVAMPKVNHDSLGAAPVWIPPTDEQTEIVEFVNTRCAKIDALVVKSTEMIGNLQEYRSALITDAVTGKIDVRGVA